MPADHLAILGTYPDLDAARRVKRQLERAGVPAYIPGEASALLGKAPEGAGVVVEVAEQDLDHAQQILAEPAPKALQKPRAMPSEEAEGLCTVEVYYDVDEADLAAQLLRAQGVPYALRGVGREIFPGLLPSLPTFRLLVREEDHAFACTILGYTQSADDVEDDAFVEGEPPVRPRQITSQDRATADRLNESIKSPQGIPAASEDLRERIVQVSEVAPDKETDIPPPPEERNILVQEQPTSSALFIWLTLLAAGIGWIIFHFIYFNVWQE